MGGQFSAGGDLTLRAGAAIDIAALGLEFSRDDKIKGGYDRAASLKNTLAELQTGGNLILAAGEDLTLVGVKATASGDATLKAGGDVTIASVQDTSSRDLKLDIKTRGFLGTQTNIRREASASQTQASTVTAGEDISITAETGDVALDATRLKSGDETLLQAQEGLSQLSSRLRLSFLRQHFHVLLTFEVRRGAQADHSGR